MTGNRTPSGSQLTLPTEAHGTEEDARAFWAEARRFFRTGRGGGIDGAELVPALLARFRDVDTLRYAYPLWIADPAPTRPEPLVQPLAELLEDALAGSAPEPNTARALKDNVARIEVAARELVAGTTGLTPFRDVVEAAVQQVVDELALPGGEGETLAADAESLLTHLPSGGSLLPLSHESPLVLFEAVARAVHRSLVDPFARTVADVVRRIRDCLDVERTKSADARDPGRLSSSFGGGGGFIDTKALAEILPRESASEGLKPARLDRLGEALRELEGFDADAVDADPIVVRLRLDAPTDDGRDAFSEAVALFDERMQSAARLVAALQVAQLELRGEYHPSVHDEFYADFDWRNFDEEEAALTPPVVVAVEENRLAEAGLQALTRLLFTGRPLKMLVLRTDAGSGPDDGDRPFRHELEHLAVAHPETFVLQACSVDAAHMAAGYARALATPRPAVLHVFTSGDDREVDDAAGFLAAGAALDSRDFPLFEYDPSTETESAWSTRFSIVGNPQPEQEWPVHEMHVADDAGAESDLALAFTFADRAAARPEWSGRFLEVPPRFWCAEMVPLADYLRLAPADAAETMPYIWMADAAGGMRRVTCTHDVVLACRDRLNHWRILQELSGVRNPHAERAARAALAEAREEAARERRVLEEEHEQEVERVRRETAGEAMERLAAVLMNMDDATLAQLPASPTAQPADVTTDRAEPATDEPTASDEPPLDEDISEEPWIASALCTSCNECIDVNPVMFRYNGDKLAYLADPSAGTFAQLVIAAEKCPARCIHPGAPLDPNEPNLDALTKRAAKFR